MGVPRFMRRLDHSTLCVSEQLKVLQNLQRDYPEVVHVAARLRDPDGYPVLAIAVTLVLVRSHFVTGGPGGLVPLASLEAGGAGARVDSAKCIVEFTAEPTRFPDAINWSDIIVEQVFGHGEAASVEHALRCHGSAQHGVGGGLTEALNVAVDAMRRFLPAP